MYNFGGIQSRNPRLYAVNNSTFCGDTAEIGITPNISECPGHILTYFTGVVGILVRMIIQIFVWQLPKGRCYDNQLNLGDIFHRRRAERPLLFASAFDNGLADCKPAFNRFNGNNQTTSCSNFVNSCPIISRVYADKTHNYCHNSPAIWRQSSFVTLVFWNGLEDRNFDSAD